MGAGADYLEELRIKAEFCLETGIQPSEYDQLTTDERTAFLTYHNERVERQKGS